MPERIFQASARSEWVRLRTLIVLRWLAIGGQLTAVLVAHYGLGMQVHLGLCVLAIGASVIFNLAATFMLPENRRLSQRETTLTLLFDVAQLIFLLFVSGGLNNPFALFILAPVTISATTLRVDATLLVGGVALIGVSFLAVFYLPLKFADGTELSLPDIYVAGAWSALLLGVVFLSSYARRVTTETFSMSQALAATQMALSREQELANLGGVVAAAAHEMGTPLATIKLVASELADELADRPDLKEDAALIGDQAERLREILRDMGRAGKEDLMVKTAPLTSVVQEAAEPHEDRGKDIVFLYNGSLDLPALEDIPYGPRNPEFVHGIRNLIQNAVDFAETTVWVQTVWTNDSVRVMVGDNGRGFPPDMLGRLGDPFLSTRRRGNGPERPGYDGMGLGLFIAKTLLERTGAEVTFTNADTRVGGSTARYLGAMAGASGAIVSVRWPRHAIEVSRAGPLGPNRPIDIAPAVGGLTNP